MFRTIASVIKWTLIPGLLVGSVFSSLAASYGPPARLAICVVAMVLTLRAAWSRKYYWAAGFAATLVAFSPLFLVVKLFLWMGFVCTMVLMTLLTAFRRQPAPSEIQ